MRVAANFIDFTFVAMSIAYFYLRTQIKSELYLRPTMEPQRVIVHDSPITSLVLSLIGSKHNVCRNRCRLFPTFKATFPDDRAVHENS